MKKCPNGHNVGDNVKFCPTCGAEITENGERFCQSCGNERKGTEKFCSQCGTPYLKTLSSPNVQAHKQKSKRGLVVAIMACLLILVLGGVAWYFLGNTKDKYSLEELAKATVNYDAVGDFHDGLAMVTKGDKYGFIDKMGNEVIPCIYDFMEETDCSFHEGLAFVHQGDNYYFIDKEGKKAFDFKYDAANDFSEGLAVVWKDGKCGYIDKKGNEVIALTDKYFGDDFSEGLAAAMSKDGKLGFIDMKGNVVIPFNYDMTEGDTPLFSEGYAAVQKEGKYGFIDKNGKEVIPLKYDNAYPFSEGLAVVMLYEGGSQETKFGFVDKKGNMVIPCEYGSAASFSEGYAAVSKDEKFFFIDKNGKQAFPISYDCWIGSFHDGIARSVNKLEEGNIMMGYIDAKGNEIAPCIYYGNDFSEGLAVIQKDGLYGFIDKKGKTTFDIQNEEVRSVIQAKIDEKEKLRKEEEKRQAEEERRRIEEERRRGVEKVVNLSHTIRDDDTRDWSGNYGANIWGGMWTYYNYVLSDFITIPVGKVWVYDRTERTSADASDIGIFYYSKDSRRSNDVRSYDNRFEIKKGDIPMFRSGDRIIVSFNPWRTKGTLSVSVFFKEKDEDVVF